MFGNRDFSPNLPFFVSDNEAGSFYFNDLGATEQSAEPVMLLLPKTEFKPNPYVANFAGGEGNLILDQALVDEELQAYDFLLLRKKDATVCKQLGRIYLGKRNEKLTDEPLHIFGRAGIELRRFSLPYGTDVDDKTSTLFITDCRNELIYHTDFTGNTINIIGLESHGINLERPADVKFKNGKIFVTEEENNRISILSYDGILLDQVGTKWVYKRGKIQKFLISMGLENYIENSTGSKGKLPELNLPLGVAVDDRENIFVVDYGNHRVQKISSEKAVIQIIGEATAFDSKPFDGPYYIDIYDETGRIYVVDREQ